MERYQLDWLFDTAARLENEIGELYHALAERFKDTPRAQQFFHLLGYEEGTHRNMLQLMAHHADPAQFPTESFEPSLERLQSALKEVCEMQRTIMAHPISLLEALQLASRLEKSEADTLVHGLLLATVPESVRTLVREFTVGTENHAERVTRYTREIEAQLVQSR